MSKNAHDIREIILGQERVSYAVKQSRRARHMRMTVGMTDGLVVTIPSPWHERFIERFLIEKASWILRHLNRLKKYEAKTVLTVTPDEYSQNKHQFLAKITKRVEFFNSLYRFSYRAIRVRNQTSLWGSCTRAGNLQFNYKLSRLPPEALDYVVVHELCHLREHNHGPEFWKLVGKTIPDYKAIRKSLRGYIMNVG